jgi:hypothetical protein
MTVDQLIENLQQVSESHGGEMEVSFCSKIELDGDGINESYTENYSSRIQLLVYVPLIRNDKDVQRLIIETT